MSKERAPIWVSPQTKRRVKMLAAVADKSMGDLVESLVDRESIKVVSEDSGIPHPNMIRNTLSEMDG